MDSARFRMPTDTFGEDLDASGVAVGIAPLPLGGCLQRRASNLAHHDSGSRAMGLPAYASTGGGALDETNFLGRFVVIRASNLRCLNGGHKAARTFEYKTNTGT